MNFSDLGKYNSSYLARLLKLIAIHHDTTVM